MQKNILNKEKRSSSSRGHKARDEEEIEEQIRYKTIASNYVDNSKRTDRNMTKEASNCDSSAVIDDINSGHTSHNETALKRFKRKFLRKNSKITEEVAPTGSSELRTQDIASPLCYNAMKFRIDEHIYEVPFTNLNVEDDTKEEEEHVYENGYVWAANNIPKRNSAGRRQEKCSVVCNEADDFNGCRGGEVNKSNSSKGRWKEAKSMSLPAGKGLPNGFPLPGLVSTSQRKCSFDVSSNESSDEGPDGLPSACKPSGDSHFLRSQSLPARPKLDFSQHFLNGLNDLCKCGWYWGPLSSKEAEAKLHGKPDGTFLVRDSNDNHYLLSLSFRSEGRTLHTRIEFCKGKFSFYAAPFITSGCHESIIDLIDDCMDKSKEKVFCYSKGRGHNGAAFPVRLMKAYSRFEHVCSLQHLCRFVIRQHFTLENIGEMPLPGMMKKYLWKNHFDAKED